MKSRCVGSYPHLHHLALPLTKPIRTGQRAKQANINTKKYKDKDKSKHKDKCKYKYKHKDKYNKQSRRTGLHSSMTLFGWHRKRSLSVGRSFYFYYHGNGMVVMMMMMVTTM